AGAGEAETGAAYGQAAPGSRWIDGHHAEPPSAPGRFRTCRIAAPRLPRDACLLGIRSLHGRPRLIASSPLISVAVAPPRHLAAGREARGTPSARWLLSSLS